MSDSSSHHSSDLQITSKKRKWDEIGEQGTPSPANGGGDLASKIDDGIVDECELLSDEEKAAADAAGWESGSVSGSSDLQPSKRAKLAPPSNVSDGPGPGSNSDAESQWNSDDIAIDPDIPISEDSEDDLGGPSSRYLPALNGGFLQGDYGSDIDDIDPPKKKNRLGQRKRQAIWERTYGESANHLQKQETPQTRGRGRGTGRGRGQDYQRGREYGRGRGRGQDYGRGQGRGRGRGQDYGRGRGRGRGRGQDDQRGRGSVQGQGRGRGRMQDYGRGRDEESGRSRGHGRSASSGRGSFGARGNDRGSQRGSGRGTGRGRGSTQTNELHPSWEAKRIAKQRESQQMSATLSGRSGGKKIKFD
ncbi:Bud-site selection protein [Cantharellus anzutake]|uniref:Bud-site selection protein n=1 Tax=Cantharellus anzutake TaxID=1750568 RepID=UPI001908BD48|nr:Bud-site selection protein [Cantharellus anzutake]KAF8327468.1 Bud-site selection protein [Cantharellus anzutake]